MTTKGRDDVATVIERTLAGGPRVLHIALDASTVPVRLARGHDREVECLRWPAEPDEQWGPDVGRRDTVDDWAQPFPVAPVDVVVVEDVPDDSHDADQFFRTLGTGAPVPGALVVISGVRDLTGPIASAGFVPGVRRSSGPRRAATHHGRPLPVLHHGPAAVPRRRRGERGGGPSPRPRARAHPRAARPRARHDRPRDAVGQGRAAGDGPPCQRPPGTAAAATAQERPAARPRGPGVARA
ncbi:hypothetical protein [Nocardioides sp. B-3]|uniref:hypothetical protein n=1 Tax=Nocardioides sp. B-3 TaxID=2895565 RepID=UPI002152DAA7|nr:hypothetical protein [Nocardioides sp. B-3]UUZ59823.1 hypothetical protein LP418_01725 [Nocardioides sp. B-3]